ncbi:MAG TPA: folate-binding protein [Burkholderiales bacterium]|nr:folate-binding protein [Burkholderiales bacterium]
MSVIQHAEHLATPQSGRLAGDFVARLDHLGTLRFGGEDAEGFLQGQLSCDVAEVSPRSSSYGAYCSAKGRMLASFLLWRDGEGFAMALSRDLAAAVQKQLSKFVLRSKVKVSDASESIVLVGASGAQAERALADAFPDAGAHLRTRDGRLLLALPAAEAAGKLGGLELSDAARWRWLDIRAGLPLITAVTRDQFVPQMANLELIGGVSFEKGCYTGQEIVARTQHLGKVKRRMFLANVAALAQAGDPLHSDDLGDQLGGTVLNAEASPEGGYDLLAVLQITSRERSTVRLKGRDGPVLRFLPLPYAVA